jgi:hypothetical protein
MRCLVPSILFKLLAVTEDEKEGYFSSTRSVLHCIVSAEIWAKNRYELLDALETVDTRQELVVRRACNTRKLLHVLIGI